MGLAKAT